MNETASLPLSLIDRFYLLLLRLIARLPIPVLQALGRLIGNWAHILPQVTPVFVTRRNLYLCFPEKSKKELDQLCVQSLQSNAMTFLEFAKCWGMPPQYSIEKIVKVRGEEIFRNALAQGCGTLALVPHFGNWEFMNAWTAQYAHLTVMYKPTKEPGVDLFVLEARSRLNAELVPTDDSGVRSLLRALKRNGFVAVLPDHVPQPKGGVSAPFFGIETLSTVLASRLWQRTHCAVIVMYARRCPDTIGFELVIEEADPAFFSEDIKESVTGMNRTIERVIRTSPADYQWAYRRFKSCSHIHNIYDRSHPPQFDAEHPGKRHFYRTPSAK